MQTIQSLCDDCALNRLILYNVTLVYSSDNFTQQQFCAMFNFEIPHSNVDFGCDCLSPAYLVSILSRVMVTCPLQGVYLGVLLLSSSSLVSIHVNFPLISPSSYLGNWILQNVRWIISKYNQSFYNFTPSHCQSTIVIGLNLHAIVCMILLCNSSPTGEVQLSLLLVSVVNIIVQVVCHQGPT